MGKTQTICSSSTGGPFSRGWRGASSCSNPIPRTWPVIKNRWPDQVGIYWWKRAGMQSCWDWEAINKVGHPLGHYWHLWLWASFTKGCCKEGHIRGNPFCSHTKLVILVYASLFMSEFVNICSILLFSFFMVMLPLAATLRAKAALLQEEARGHFAASLAVLQTSVLWELLEDLFVKFLRLRKKRVYPPKKSQAEDKPSSNASGPSAPTLSDTPSTMVKVIFP